MLIDLCLRERIDYGERQSRQHFLMLYLWPRPERPSPLISQKASRLCSGFYPGPHNNAIFSLLYFGYSCPLQGTCPSPAAITGWPSPITVTVGAVITP